MRGTPITAAHDQMNRVTALQSTSNPTTMFSYAYGKTGNRLSASDRNGSSNYTYDSIYRMTEEAISRSEAKGTLTYGLDPVGNRQSLASTVTGISQQSASYNVNDQALANTYDANGNTLGANGKSYAYDSFDRMTSFNGGSVTMVYDGDGNRVKKISGGVTTQYLVDELNPTGLPQVMDEVVKSGVAQRTYLYGLRRISQTQVASGTTSYYGYDAHGDVRSLMNNGGVVTDTYDYDAFGNVVGSTGTTPNVYRYQGEAFDSETGLYYMRARYYDPTVGRFLNVDQMTDQGEHPYSYAAADPVNGHDPTGTQDVIEYSLLMWLYTAHVPPPRGYMSCQGGILFSGTGAGSGGGSGMQADASAGATMARLGLACQLGGKGPGRSGNPPQPPKGSCCDEARKPPLSIPALSPIINNRTHALTPNPC
jgi:RHS repeat-associated protein